MKKKTAAKVGLASLAVMLGGGTILMNTQAYTHPEPPGLAEAEGGRDNKILHMEAGRRQPCLLYTSGTLGHVGGANRAGGIHRSRRAFLRTGADNGRFRFLPVLGQRQKVRLIHLV